MNNLVPKKFYIDKSGRKWMATPYQQAQPFAISAGITAGSAIAAGGLAAATVGNVLAVISGTLVAVSLAMTVVGLATGSSKLMKIGGYIGLGGGVAGLGASLAGGATPAIANEAVSQTATEVAKPAVKTASTDAIKQTALTTGKTITEPLAQQAPLAATTPIGKNIADTAGPAQLTSNVAKPVIPQVTSVDASLGADLGVKPIASQGGFFDFMDSPGFANKLKLGEIAVQGVSGLIGGAYTSGVQDQNFDLKNQELAMQSDYYKGQTANDAAKINQAQQAQDYNQMAEERKYQNANTQGRGMLTTRVLTPEERLAASRASAANAAANAKILTGRA